ncbi:MAG: spore coat U domain-containing protein [Rhizobiaceae bacterium]|nr:spore coat U domain-containing protein [Rhizobiaceae bacterium]
MKKITALSSVLMVTMLNGSALGAIATSVITPMITVISTCEIETTRNLNFNSRGFLDTKRDRFGAVRVRCTNGLPYDIGMDAGLSPGGTTSVRQMTQGAETINYMVYQDQPRTTNWGNTVGTDTKSVTANGVWQNHRFYGRIPVQPTPSPGLYTDTVTVTVTY